MSSVAVSTPPLRDRVVGKKQDGPGKAVNFRASADLVGRLEEVARVLELDVSSLARMIIAEHLPAYEARAREIHARRDAASDS